MDKKPLTRRQFVAAASAGTLTLTTTRKAAAHGLVSGDAGKLAALGGTPVRQNKPWPEWPYWDEQVIDSIVKTTKSRIWCRIQSPSGTVPTFEGEYARMMGAR